MPSLVILVSAILVLLCGQTDRQTHRITVTANRFTPATVFGVDNEILAVFLTR